MKALYISLLLALFTLSCSAAAQDIATALSLLPICAQRCVVPVIVALPCNISTVQEVANCFCPNGQARSNVSMCVQNECAYSDQLTASNISYALCQSFPSPSRSDELERASIILIATCLVFVLLRGWSRLMTTNRFWRDDWLIFTAALTLFAGLVLEIPSAMKGFGQHLWSVNPDNIPQLLKLFYATQLLYIITKVLTKISLLVFFLRVFPQRWFRLAGLITIACVAVRGLIFLLLIVFQCTPIRSIWDTGLDKKCLNRILIVYVGAGTSIFEDLVILVLPMACVSALKIGPAKRFSLIVMFCVGSFACVTSMIRLKYLSGYGGTDPTWDNFNISLWSSIEISTAVICSCLPSLKPLLSKALPKLFGSGTPLPSPFSPNLSHPSAQQSKRSVRVAGEVVSMLLLPQIRSDSDLGNDSDSTQAPMLKSSNAAGRRWLSYDEDMELATMGRVGNDKVRVEMSGPVMVKALPPLLHEWDLQSGWL